MIHTQKRQCRMVVGAIITMVDVCPPIGVAVGVVILGTTTTTTRMIVILHTTTVGRMPIGG
jgi:hypothetical protein